MSIISPLVTESLVKESIVLLKVKKKDAASLQNPRHNRRSITITKRTFAVRLSIGEICTAQKDNSAVAHQPRYMAYNNNNNENVIRKRDQG